MTYGPLIVKIGGTGIEEPDKAGPLWQAVAEAHRILNGRLILVHGGGRAVDAHLDRLGFTTDRRDGIRITPDAQIGEIVAVLSGRINKSLVGAIQALGGVRAVGLCLGDGMAIRTAKADHYPFDPGRVGRVIGGGAELLTTLMEAAYLPVLSSIGLDDHGRFLNVNADDGAAGVAAALHARALILLTDVPGVLDQTGALIPRMTPADITRLIDRGVIKGGMIPKATAAARAAAAASAPATIASWNTPSDLVRIARGEAAGTTVLPG